MTSDTKIAFLDRDGVLNVDHDYVFRSDEFDWIEGAKEAIVWLNQNGYKVVVATNQSGIGRGLYTTDDFEALSNFMRSELAEVGGRIDAIYVCPHHPLAALPPFNMDCECRKPKPGMLLKGLLELDGDPDRSFFVGDKQTDMQAAEAAGIRGFLFTGGNLLEFLQNSLKN